MYSHALQQGDRRKTRPHPSSSYNDGAGGHYTDTEVDYSPDGRGRRNRTSWSGGTPDRFSLRRANLSRHTSWHERFLTNRDFDHHRLHYQRNPHETSIGRSAFQPTPYTSNRTLLSSARSSPLQQDEPNTYYKCSCGKCAFIMAVILVLVIGIGLLATFVYFTVSPGKADYVGDIPEADLKSIKEKPLLSSDQKLDAELRTGSEDDHINLIDDLDEHHRKWPPEHVDKIGPIDDYDRQRPATTTTTTLSTTQPNNDSITEIFNATKSTSDVKIAFTTENITTTTTTTTTTTPSTTLEAPKSDCKALEVQTCHGLLPYTATGRPNVVTGEFYKEDVNRAKILEKLFIDASPVFQKCHRRATEIMCMIVQPNCHDGRLIHPCRGVCKEFVDSCRNDLNDMGVVPRCDLLPDDHGPEKCLSLSLDELGAEASSFTYNISPAIPIVKETLNHMLNDTRHLLLPKIRNTGVKQNRTNDGSTTLDDVIDGNSTEAVIPEVRQASSVGVKITTLDDVIDRNITEAYKVVLPETETTNFEVESKRDRIRVEGMEKNLTVDIEVSPEAINSTNVTEGDSVVNVTEIPEPEAAKNDVDEEKQKVISISIAGVVRNEFQKNLTEETPVEVSDSREPEVVLTTKVPISTTSVFPRRRKQRPSRYRYRSRTMARRRRLKKRPGLTDDESKPTEVGTTKDPLEVDSNRHWLTKRPIPIDDDIVKTNDGKTIEESHKARPTSAKVQSKSICRPIYLQICKGELGYRRTAYPNMMQHQNVRELRTVRRTFHRSVRELKKCHKDAAAIICAMLQPECTSNGTQRNVCPDVCEDLKTSCSKTLRTFYLYPDCAINNGTCITMAELESETSGPKRRRPIVRQKTIRAKVTTRLPTTSRKFPRRRLATRTSTTTTTTVAPKTKDSTSKRREDVPSVIPYHGPNSEHSASASYVLKIEDRPKNDKRQENVASASKTVVNHKRPDGPTRRSNLRAKEHRRRIAKDPGKAIRPHRRPITSGPHRPHRPTRRPDFSKVAVKPFSSGDTGFPFSKTNRRRPTYLRKPSPDLIIGQFSTERELSAPSVRPPPIPRSPQKFGMRIRRPIPPKFMARNENIRGHRPRVTDRRPMFPKRLAATIRIRRPKPPLRMERKRRPMSAVLESRSSLIDVDALPFVVPYKLPRLVGGDQAENSPRKASLDPVESKITSYSARTIDLGSIRAVLLEQNKNLFDRHYLEKMDSPDLEHQSIIKGAKSANSSHEAISIQISDRTTTDDDGLTETPVTTGATQTDETLDSSADVTGTGESDRTTDGRTVTTRAAQSGSSETYDGGTTQRRTSGGSKRTTSGRTLPVTTRSTGTDDTVHSSVTTGGITQDGFTIRPTSTTKLTPEATPTEDDDDDTVANRRFKDDRNDVETTDTLTSLSVAEPTSTTSAKLGCKGPAFICLSGKCLTSIRICDDVDDCPDGDDERYCVELSEVPTLSNETTDRQINNDLIALTEGYLMVRRRGAWLPFCADHWEERLNKQFCDKLSFRYGGEAEFRQTDNSTDYVQHGVDSMTTTTSTCRQNKIVYLKCRSYMACANLMDPRRICDGTPDCRDFSDEINCEPCDYDTEFLCMRSQTCIERRHVCDGLPHCRHGEDEQNCLILSKTGRIRGEFTQVPLPIEPSGYLMVRRGTHYHQVCSDSWIPNLSRAICRQFSYKSLKKLESRHSAYNMPNIALSKFSARISARFVTSPLYTRFEPQNVDRLNAKNCSVVHITCDNIACGQPPPQLVTGGYYHNSDAGMWPWIVALYSNGNFRCPAVLIDQEWAITSANCVKRRKEEYLVVRAGTKRLQHYNPYEQVAEVNYVSLSSEYEESQIDIANQLAMLHFYKPIQPTSKVWPICLPPEIEDSSYMEQCVAIGWNTFDRSNSTNDYRMQRANVTAMERCKDLMESSEELKNDEMCIQSLRSADATCQEVQGSILMCKVIGRWTAIGVTNSTIETCRNNYSVFTRLKSHLGWIEDVQGKIDKRGIEFSDNKIKTCAGGGFMCIHGNCVTSEKVCDGNVDCLDESDEQNCK